MFDALFRFFFELSPVVFSQGEFRFAASTGSYVAAAAVAVAAGADDPRVSARATAAPRERVDARRRSASRSSPSSWSACSGRCWSSRPRCRNRTFSACCWTIRAACRSPMSTASRAPSYVKSEFGANDRGLLKALSERFTVRTFRFSSAPTRTTQESDLTFGGSQSRLGAALSGVRQELAGLPVAGLVMVSDGADTADAALGEAILGLKAEGLPVFTVGVGRETLSKDIQVGRVVDAEDRAQGHDVDGRRGAVAVRLRRAEGHARRRGRRHARQHAAGVAAGCRHAGVDPGPLHGERSRAARAALPRVAAGRASSSPRTTRAKR